MDKSRHLGETKGVPRLNPDDADRLLIDYLRKKQKDPDGLHSHYGDIIPTVDIFHGDPDTFIRVKTAQQKEVFYFFSPIEGPEGRSRSPSDILAGAEFWMENSPQEDIVDEQGHKIGEKRIRRFRNWTMHELRLVGSQHAETSSAAEKAVKNHPSDNQGSTELHNYVICKIFKEEAAKKQEEDESVDGGAKEEASTVTRSQVGQSAMGSPAGAGPSSSTGTTAASPPRESGDPYTMDRAAPGRRSGGSSALRIPKEEHLQMKQPFEPLPWLGWPPTKRMTKANTRLQICGEAEGTNPGSAHDLVRLRISSGLTSAQSSTSSTTEQKDKASLQ